MRGEGKGSVQVWETRPCKRPGGLRYGRRGVAIETADRIRRSLTAFLAPGFPGPRAVSRRAFARGHYAMRCGLRRSLGVDPGMEYREWKQNWLRAQMQIRTNSAP